MKLPSLKPKEVIHILEKLGYYELRSSGSHRYFAHMNKAVHVAIPFHNKDIKMGTLRGIIKQMQMTPQEFLKFH